MNSDDPARRKAATRFRQPAEDQAGTRDRQTARSRRRGRFVGLALAGLLLVGFLWAGPLGEGVFEGVLGIGESGEWGAAGGASEAAEVPAEPAVEGMDPVPPTVTAGLVPVGDADPRPGFFAAPERAGGVDRARLVAALRAAVGAGGAVGTGVHIRALDLRGQPSATGENVDGDPGGETVYGYRSGEPSLLASNTKLFTTAAALDAMGAGHFLETRVLARGWLDEDGVLRGDLAVVGGGDPTLSWRQTVGGDIYAAFRDWGRALRQRGVREVRGHLYLDHGLFDDPIVHPDWDPRKRLRWYQVPVDALTFHENTVDVYAEPGDRLGNRRASA